MVNLTAASPVADGTRPPGLGNHPARGIEPQFRAFLDVANLAVVSVGAAHGKIMLFNGSAAPVDLLADLVGYIAG